MEDRSQLCRAEGSGGHSSLEYCACRKESMRSRVNLRDRSGHYTTCNNISIAGLRWFGKVSICILNENDYDYDVVTCVALIR